MSYSTYQGGWLSLGAYPLNVYRDNNSSCAERCLDVYTYFLQFSIIRQVYTHDSVHMSTQQLDICLRSKPILPQPTQANTRHPDAHKPHSVFSPYCLPRDPCLYDAVQHPHFLKKLICVFLGLLIILREVLLRVYNINRYPTWHGSCSTPQVLDITQHSRTQPQPRAGMCT